MLAAKVAGAFMALWLIVCLALLVFALAGVPGNYLVAAGAAGAGALGYGALTILAVRKCA